MPDILTCPSCEAYLKAIPELAGKSVQCPTCKAAMLFPIDLENGKPRLLDPPVEQMVIQCPACQVALRFKTEHAGKQALCPACQVAMTIPLVEAPEPEPESVTPANTRPKVFIGSANESLAVAEIVKAAFADSAEVEIWNSEQIFTRNRGFLESLLNAASLFDYAILIFSKDDTMVSRSVEFEAVRDNVLFEFGLFLGKLGPRRAYAICETGLKIPSDLQGISLDGFERCADGNPGPDFANTCQQLTRRILDHFASSLEFQLLPSTALAIGYFENFITRICGRLDEGTPLSLIDSSEQKSLIQYHAYRINIVIPDQMNLLDDANLKSILRNFTQIEIESTQFRNFPFYIQHIPTAADDQIELFDIPTTMRVSGETVDKIFSVEGLGSNRLQELALEREVINFEKTLRLLLARRPAWEKSIVYKKLSDYI